MESVTPPDDPEAPKIEPILTTIEFQAKITGWLQSINKKFNFMVGSTVFLLAGILAVAIYVAVNTARTHDALCTFRSDLITRISQSQEFLDHPETFPAIKLTPALRNQIQTQLDGQRRTVASLSGLGCGN